MEWAGVQGIEELRDFPEVQIDAPASAPGARRPAWQPSREWFRGTRSPSLCA